MGDDLPNSDVADQFHADLFLKLLTDSDNTEFRTTWKKERAWTGAKTASRKVSTDSLGRPAHRENQGNFQTLFNNLGRSHLLNHTCNRPSPSARSA